MRQVFAWKEDRLETAICGQVRQTGAKKVEIRLLTERSYVRVRQNQASTKHKAPAASCASLQALRGASISADAVNPARGIGMRKGTAYS